MTMRTSRPPSKLFACLLVASALALASAYPVQHGSCARRRQRDHEQQYGYGGPHHNEQYGNEQYGDGHGYGHSGPEQHGYDNPYGPGDAMLAQQGATVDAALNTPTVAKESTQQEVKPVAAAVPAQQASSSDGQQQKQDETVQAQITAETVAAEPKYDVYGGYDFHQGLQQTLWQNRKIGVPPGPPKNLNGILFPGPSQDLKEDGEMCLSDWVCCSGQCENNVCCTDEKHKLGHHCFSPNHCCSGNCQDQTCCKLGTVAVDVACTANDNCCSSLCLNGFCCPAGTLALTQPCSSNSQCCSGQCTQPGNGVAGVCCVPPNDVLACSATAPCCTGTCDLITGRCA